MNKKKIYKLVIFIISIIGLCLPIIIQASETDQVSQVVDKIVFCKDIEEKGPVLETNIFYSWDEKVICWINFSYRSETPFVISWRWVDPNGVIYHVGEIEMEPGIYQNYRTWYWISISNHYPENFPGEWKTGFYIDNSKLIEKYFVIE